MTSEQTIILNRIKDDVAKEAGCGWYDFMPAKHEENWKEVCRRYSKEMNRELIEAHKLQMSFEQGKWYKGDMEDKITSLEQEIERLKAFKDYVHKRLDDAGIEKDPESIHKESGCRIGGRLDIVLNDMCTKVSRQKSCEASLGKASENAVASLVYGGNNHEGEAYAVIDAGSILNKFNIVIIE